MRFSGSPIRECGGRGKTIMSKLKVSMRDIGRVRIFDLEGSPTQESLQDVSWKIQRSIRRHRLQRVILNLQMIHDLEPLGVRKLLAACLRPQRSLIYGVNGVMADTINENHLPNNIKICSSEKEVAEDLGPFLLEKEEEKRFSSDGAVSKKNTPGVLLEKRRSKRMHVALPIDLEIWTQDGKTVATHAIATNISEGGLFAEYLDLDASQQIDALTPLAGLKVKLRIYPSSNFPEEYALEGKIIRKEIRKKQLGIAVEFESHPQFDMPGGG